jgi:hypothetical protein
MYATDVLAMTLPDTNQQRSEEVSDTMIWPKERGYVATSL